MILPLMCLTLVFAAPMLTMLAALYHVASMRSRSASARATSGWVGE